MSEYELATLVFRDATLAIREQTLWVAIAEVVVTLLIGVGQIAIVWIGIRAMQRAGDIRAQEQDRRHTEAQNNHTQAMTALRELIVRTGRGAGT